MQPSKMTDREFIKSQLSAKQNDLRELHVQRRIAVAVFEKERNLLEHQIETLEWHLGKVAK